MRESETPDELADLNAFKLRAAKIPADELALIATRFSIRTVVTFWSPKRSKYTEKQLLLAILANYFSWAGCVHPDLKGELSSIADALLKTKLALEIETHD